MYPCRSLEVVFFTSQQVHREPYSGKYTDWLLLVLLSQNIDRQRESAGATCELNLKNSCNVVGQLENLFLRAIQSAYPSATNPVTQIQVSKHADYQCNAAMALAKVCDGLQYCLFLFINVSYIFCLLLL